MGSDAVGFLREARWRRLRLARTSRSFFKSLPRATKKARQGRAIPWRREEDDLRLYELGCSRLFARGSMASATPRANLAEFLQGSSPRHEKSPPRAGNSVAQRRGFEPPDESPPSHDFQSCSLNHSDISANIPAKKAIDFARVSAKSLRKISLFTAFAQRAGENAESMPRKG